MVFQVWYVPFAAVVQRVCAFFSSLCALNSSQSLAAIFHTNREIERIYRIDIIKMASAMYRVEEV